MFISRSAEEAGGLELKTGTYTSISFSTEIEVSNNVNII
jgi:hypothetical protein